MASATPALMFWTEENELKLIRLWRDTPCLFDTNSKTMANRRARHKAMEELSRVMGIPVDPIAKHMTSLRTQYARYTRNAANGKQPAWLKTERQKWIIQEMDFLRPFLRRLSFAPYGEDDYNADDVELSLTECADGEDPTVDDLGTDSDVNNTNTVVHRQDNVAFDKARRRDKSFAHKSGVKRRHKQQQQREAGNQSALKSLRSVPQESKSSKATDSSSDDDSIFAQYIVGELHKITDPQTKLVLAHNITTLIFEARMNQLRDNGASGAVTSRSTASHSTSRVLPSRDSSASTNQRAFLKSSRHDVRNKSIPVGNGDGRKRKQVVDDVQLEADDEDLEESSEEDTEETGEEELENKAELESCTTVKRENHD